MIKSLPADQHQQEEFYCVSIYIAIDATFPAKNQYPVVADPVGTDLNQFWFKYSNDAVDGTLGRQRILHDNQRFVGGVAWRQNEETFDGIRALGFLGDKLSLDLSYVNQVNRVFGPNDGANPAI